MEGGYEAEEERYAGEGLLMLLLWSVPVLEVGRGDMLMVVSEEDEGLGGLATEEL